MAHAQMKEQQRSGKFGHRPSLGKMRGSDDSGKAEFSGGKPDPTLSSSQQWTFIKIN